MYGGRPRLTDTSSAHEICVLCVDQQAERKDRQRDRRWIEDVGAPAVALPGDELLAQHGRRDHQKLQVEPVVPEPQEQVGAEDDRKRLQIPGSTCRAATSRPAYPAHRGKRSAPGSAERSDRPRASTSPNTGRCWSASRSERNAPAGARTRTAARDRARRRPPPDDTSKQRAARPPRPKMSHASRGLSRDPRDQRESRQAPRSAATPARTAGSAAARVRSGLTAAA